MVHDAVSYVCKASQACNKPCWQDPVDQAEHPHDVNCLAVEAPNIGNKQTESLQLMVQVRNAWLCGCRKHLHSPVCWEVGPTLILYSHCDSDLPALAGIFLLLHVAKLETLD